ncbi:MAG: hypothetical protein GF372_01825 [Candidatus Marinimicrobia bacterium]|nr:hypothetical protein [Candidatus Neomarinimicrobiota bacterium]
MTSFSVCIKVSAVFFLIVFLTGCNKNPSEPDLGAPSPGNSGILSYSNLTPTGFTLNWGPAVDDKSEQEVLEYKVFHSNLDNIANVTEMEDNGTIMQDWTQNITSKSMSGLDFTRYNFFNVAVRDEEGQIAPYVMTILSPMPDFDQDGPVPGDLGLITSSDILKTSMKLHWEAATDNGTPSDELAYALVMSESDNIGTVENAESNGTVVMDWMLGANSFTVTGLSENTNYYFTVLVRDADKNTSAYAMTSIRTFRPKIYWSDWKERKVYRANLDGTDIEIITQTLESTITLGGRLSFDLENQKIYRSDTQGQIIVRSNFDGSALEEVLSNSNDGITSPMGVTVVPEIEKIYWFDKANQIFKRANLDGEMIESLISSVSVLDDVSDLDIRVSTESDSLRAYYGESTFVGRYEYGEAGWLLSVNVNSTHGLQNVQSIAFDSKNSTIYFSDIGRDSIYTIDDPESSGTATALPLQLVGDFYGLYVDEVSEHLYFYDETHTQIVRWKIGTSYTVEEIITTDDVDLNSISDIVVVNY